MTTVVEAKQRGDALRAHDLQDVNARRAGINASDIQKINQQYDDQYREIKGLTESGSDAQVLAILDTGRPPKN
ncbi:hypothetical protein [Salinicola corii]|uniref:hypothetical protein n=1 Tax=Salinicola corii TaxID=2606937 RepID=UPI001CA904D7|nr:hypothetical protein [Salinicola corii]